MGEATAAAAGEADAAPRHTEKGASFFFSYSFISISAEMETSSSIKHTAGAI